MKNYPQEAFVFVVVPGNYSLVEPLSFANTRMELRSLRAYDQHSKKCVDGENIILFRASGSEPKTIEQCGQACDADSRCKAFEYGVAHGGASTNYKPGDCQLQSSDNMGTCDGGAYNFDLYIPNGNIAPVLIKCTTRCLNIDINVGQNIYPPKLISGFHFIAQENKKAATLEKGGAIYIANLQSNDDSVNIEACIFENFSVLISGGAIYFVNMAGIINLRNLAFVHNDAQTSGGALYFESSLQVILIHISFIQNSAKAGGAIAINSKAGIPSSLNISQMISTGDTAEVQGGGIFIGRSSNLDITNSHFQNNSAPVGAAVAIQAARVNAVDLVVNGARTTDESKFTASAIECLAGSLVLESTKVSNTHGRGVQSTACLIYVHDSNFHHNYLPLGKGAGFLFVSNSEMEITSSTFSFNVAVADNGGAIACLGCLKMNIDDTKFDRNVAERGGGLYLSDVPSTKSAALLTSIVFDSNTAAVGGGGAIYHIGQEAAEIVNLLTSMNVEHYGNGHGQATNGVKCGVINSNQQVQREQRERHVLNFNQIQPPIQVSVFDQYSTVVKDTGVNMQVTVTCENNVEASVLGTSIMFIDDSSGIASFNNLQLAGRPGQHILTFTVNMGDGSEDIATSVTMTVDGCPPGMELIDLPGGSGFICEDCVGGQFSSGTPSTCESCGQGQFSIQSSSNCTFCKLGEVQRSGDYSLCFLCSSGFYSLLPGNSVDGTSFSENTIPPTAQCIPCPVGGTCENGLPIAKSGYWRPKPKINASFYKCREPSACLGLRNEAILTNETLRLNDFNESCADGYMGRLCHRCSLNFARNGPNKCSRCVSTGTAALLLALLGVLVVFVVFAVFIYQSMSTSVNDPTNAALTLKIIAAHLQVLAIAAHLPFQWPDVLVGMFRSFDAVSSVSDDVINLECVLTDSKSDSSVVYSNTLVMLLSPLVFVLTAILFWTLVYFRKLQTFRRLAIEASEQPTTRTTRTSQDAIFASSLTTTTRTPTTTPTTTTTTTTTTVSMLKPTFIKMKHNILVSCVVVMVLIHPTLTRRSVELLTCDKISPSSTKQFLRSDLEEECWVGRHFNWAVGIGIPFLILYSAGIPIASFYMLYKRKHKLKTDESTVSRFGFLYLGYQVWWWEIIIMIRKVLMVLIDVVLAPAGVAVQALMAMLLLSAMFAVTLVVKPFENPILQALELASLLVSLSTLWMGSFFWAANDNDLHTVLSAIIFIANVVFLVVTFFVLLRGGCQDYQVKHHIIELGRTTARGASFMKRKMSRASMMPSAARTDEQNTSSTRQSIESRPSSVPDMNIAWPETSGTKFEEKTNPMLMRRNIGDEGDIEMSNVAPSSLLSPVSRDNDMLPMSSLPVRSHLLLCKKN